VGIFTTDSLKEERRRDLIRTTYLRFYVNTTTPKLICALQEILNNSLANEEDCQMAYTFVIGGNPSGTTELMEFNDTYPITLNGQSLENSTNRYDTVYLNIRENMNDGKSQTWFRYATMVLYNHYFDYISLHHKFPVQPERAFYSQRGQSDRYACALPPASDSPNPSGKAFLRPPNKEFGQFSKLLEGVY
jgi:hypothetical protein